MTVPADEFIRRFLLHVLPDGMHRIRYFGILANGCRATTLDCAREALGAVGCAVSGETAGGPEGDHEQDRDPGAETVAAPVACPHCGGVLRLVREISPPAGAHRRPRPAAGATTLRHETMNQPLASNHGSADLTPTHPPTRPRWWTPDTSGSPPAKAPNVRGPNRPPDRPGRRKPAILSS